MTGDPNMMMYGQPPPADGQFYPPEYQYPPAVVQYQAPPPIYTSATTTTVVTQPAVMSNAVLKYSEYPVRIFCPHCKAQIVTSCEHVGGTFAWLMCLIIFFMGGALGCCLVPFCIDGMRDVNHTCPNCHKLVGCYRRM